MSSPVCEFGGHRVHLTLFQVPLSSRNLSEEAHFYLVSLQMSVSTLSLDHRVPTVSADRTPWEVVKTVVSKGAYQVGFKSDPLRL